MTKHKHAEVIKAWADGQEVQVMTNSGWADVGRQPSWFYSNEYRLKPSAPKWPQTTMTYQQLKEAYLYVPSVICWDEMAAISLANAAIAHACEYGALVPADKVREIEAKARAEGVKEGAKQEHERIRLMAQFASPVGGQLVGYQVGNLK